jgi:hypothetical protein
LTVSVYEALWTAEPVPVTVMVYEPGVAAVVVATVMVDDPPDVTAAGLKLTDTPVGAPARRGGGAPGGCPSWGTRRRCCRY